MITNGYVIRLGKLRLEEVVPMRSVRIVFEPNGSHLWEAELSLCFWQKDSNGMIQYWMNKFFVKRRLKLSHLWRQSLSQNLTRINLGNQKSTKMMTFMRKTWERWNFAWWNGHKDWRISFSLIKKKCINFYGRLIIFMQNFFVFFDSLDILMSHNSTKSEYTIKIQCFFFVFRLLRQTADISSLHS